MIAAAMVGGVLVYLGMSGGGGGGGGGGGSTLPLMLDIATGLI
jgi:preprotein translocase subunit SecG